MQHDLRIFYQICGNLLIFFSLFFWVWDKHLLPIITMVTSSTLNISFRFTNYLLWQDTPEDQLWGMWNTTPYKLCGCQCTISYIVIISIVKMTIYLYAQPKPFWASIATSHIGYNHGESKWTNERSHLPYCGDELNQVKWTHSYFVLHNSFSQIHKDNNIISDQSKVKI